MHTLACLIESCQTVYGLYSCVEKNVTPSRSLCLKIVNEKCQFLHFRRLLFSSLTSYPSKTHGISRTFKGFRKVYEWRSFVEGYAKFGQRAAHGLRKTVLHICSDLFKPVQTCSHLFTPVQTCSNRKHLFTPVHTSVTIYALHAITVSRWIFPLRELIFFNLISYLAGIAYFSWPNRALSVVRHVYL